MGSLVGLNLLIDTHVFFWLETDPQKLGSKLEIFRSPKNAIHVSAALVWEIAAKRAKGKLEFSGSICDAITKRGFVIVPVSGEHAELAGMLPQHHADPIDRMMIAQALLEQLTLVTHDALIMRYTVPLLKV